MSVPACSSRSSWASCANQRRRSELPGPICTRGSGNALTELVVGAGGGVDVVATQGAKPMVPSRELAPWSAGPGSNGRSAPPVSVMFLQPEAGRSLPCWSCLLSYPAERRQVEDDAVERPGAAVEPDESRDRCPARSRNPKPGIQNPNALRCGTGGRRTRSIRWRSGTSSGSRLADDVDRRLGECRVAGRRRNL